MIRISTCLIIMHEDVLTFHRVHVIVKSKVKVNSERSFKCDFNTPHIDSAEIIYNIIMFAGAGGNGQEFSGSGRKKTALAVHQHTG